MSGFILPLCEGESRPARSAAAGGQFGDFLCKAAEEGNFTTGKDRSVPIAESRIEGGSGMLRTRSPYILETCSRVVLLREPRGTTAIARMRSESISPAR